jgi:hypothetical protein
MSFRPRLGGELARSLVPGRSRVASSTCNPPSNFVEPAVHGDALLLAVELERQRAAFNHLDRAEGAVLDADAVLIVQEQVPATVSWISTSLALLGPC